MLQWVFVRRTLTGSLVRRLTTMAAQDATSEAAIDRAERTMQRFWKHVTIRDDKDGCTIMLDHRQLRTPDRHVITLPQNQRPLAILTAAEWDAQTHNLKPYALPLTSLIARAMDALGPDSTIRSEVIDKLLSYLDTDAVCYHEDDPPALTKLQDHHWNPVLEWVRRTYGVTIHTTQEIFALSQPENTKTQLRKVVEAMDSLELAALEKAVMSTKSFLIGLALVKDGITVEEAAQAAHVEMLAQLDRWGEVEDSHDVEREYIRRTLGAVSCAVMHHQNN